MLDLDFIKSKRIERKLTLKEVGFALGFKNASNYMKYECGKYVIKAEMLPVLADLFECSVSDFFKGDNDSSPNKSLKLNLD